MPSTFTWLDYSETDRRKMLDVINAFSEKETRDELGFGGIRDAFADTLFPGTSTIQTRARYFLFVPWIYLRLERERVAPDDFGQHAKRDELRLIEALLRGGEKSEGSGVIGGRARTKLQRLPSSVYWFGLVTWGICLFDGSQDQYQRSLGRFYDVARARRRMRTNEDDLLDEPIQCNWHPDIPTAPSGFLDRTTFRLSYVEADYLSERIRMRTRSSLLAFLLDAEFTPAGSNFMWEHPSVDVFPAALREQVAHAQNFSEATYGAPLLYNLLLAELTRNEQRINDYRARLQSWATRLEQRQAALAAWNLDRFQEIITATRANVHWKSWQFVRNWIEAIRIPRAAAGVAENGALRQLVHDREVALKRRLSRLENPRARDLWSGEAGTGQLNYRWTSAQRILADIYEGLTTR